MGIGGFRWEIKCGIVEGWIQGEIVGEGLGFSVAKSGGLDGWEGVDCGARCVIGRMRWKVRENVEYRWEVQCGVLKD